MKRNTWYVKFSLHSGYKIYLKFHFSLSRATTTKNPAYSSNLKYPINKLEYFIHIPADGAKGID